MAQQFIGDLLLRAGINLSRMQADVNSLKGIVADIPKHLQGAVGEIDLVPPDVHAQGGRIAERIAHGIEGDARRIRAAVGTAVADAVDGSEGAIGQVAAAQAQAAQSVGAAAREAGQIVQTSLLDTFDQLSDLPLFDGVAADIREVAAASQAMAQAVHPMEEWAASVRRAREEQAAAAEAARLAAAAAITDTDRERMRAQELAELAEYTARREREIAARRAAEEQQEAAQAVERARAGILAQVQAQEALYRDSRARIKEAQIRMLLSPAEARQAAIEAATEYNDAIIEILDRHHSRADPAAPFAGAAGQQMYIGVANSLKQVDENTQRATRSTKQMTLSMASMAASALRLPPIVGRLTTELATVAAGGALSLAIVAGFTAIGAGIRKLTEDARKLKEEAAAATRRLEELARVRALPVGGQLEADVEGQQARIDALIGERERLLAYVESLRRQPLTDEVAAADAAARDRLAVIEREYEKASRLVRAGEEALAEARRNAQVSALTTIVSSGLGTEDQIARVRQGVERELQLLASIRAHPLLFRDPEATEAATVVRIGQLEGALNSLEPSTQVVNRLNTALERTAETIRLMAVTQPLGLLFADELPEGPLRDAFQESEKLHRELTSINQLLKDAGDVGAAVPPGLEERRKAIVEKLLETEADVAAHVAKMSDALSNLKIEPSIAIPTFAGPDPLGAIPALRTAENEFTKSLVNIRSKMALGLIDKEEFERQAMAAGLAFNVSLLREIEKLKASGKLDEALALSAKLTFEVDIDAREKAVQAARGAVAHFNETIQASSEVISAFGDLADVVGDVSIVLSSTLRGIESALGGLPRVREGMAVLDEVWSAIDKAVEEARKAGEDPVKAGAEMAEALAGTQLLGSLAVMSGAVTIASGVVGIFTSILSARAERERRHAEIVRNASDAVERFRLQIEGFRLDTPGSQRPFQRFGADPDLLRELDPNRIWASLGHPAGWNRTRFINRQTEILDKFLDEYGITMAQLMAAAREHGIELFDERGYAVIESFGKLAEITDLAVKAMTGFSKTVLDEIQQRRSILDRLRGVERDPVLTPLGDLQTLAPQLFDRYFGGIDTGDREAVRNAAIQMFLDFADSAEWFADLMGEHLSRSDFLSIVDSMADGFAQLDDVVHDVVGALTNVPQGFRILNLEMERFNAMQRATAESLSNQSGPPTPSAPPAPGSIVTPVRPDGPGTGPVVHDHRVITIEIRRDFGESEEEFDRRVQRVIRSTDRQDGLTFHNDPYSKYR